MKKVVDAQQVCHLWANKSQSDATTPNRNLYFDGDHIWSYGSHFLAARHIGDVALITTRTYSVTTSKQMSYIRRAASHLRTFEVLDPSAHSKAAHRANLAELRTEYEHTVLKASRARTNAPYLLESAERQLQHANDYASHFKLTTRIKPADVTMIRARADKQAAKAKAAADKAARIRAMADAEKLELWRAGEFNGSLYGIPVACRLTSDGNTVQTSHGASFPVADAARGMSFVKRQMLTLGSSEAWHSNGEHVQLGHFQIDSITSTGIVSGCHRVSSDEILRLDALINARSVAA